MPNFGMVTRIHVLTAIKNYDKAGAASFASEHGPAQDLLVERGQRYDPRLLLASAYQRAAGVDLAAANLGDDAPEVMRRLDFNVVSAVEPVAPAKRVPGTRPSPRPTARAASAKPAAPVKAEPVVNLCPTCMMQLPASGRCDYCD